MINVQKIYFKIRSSIKILANNIKNYTNDQVYVNSRCPWPSTVLNCQIRHGSYNSKTPVVVAFTKMATDCDYTSECRTWKAVNGLHNFRVILYYLLHLFAAPSTAIRM